MKNSIIVIVFCLISAISFGQTKSIEAFYNKYKTYENVTDVTLKGWLLNMAMSSESEGKEDVLEKISKLRVLVMDEGNLVSKTELSGLLKSVRSEKFEDLMTVRDDETKVDFLIREEGKFVTNLLVLVHEPDGFVLISLEGMLDLKDLENINFDIEGGDHFKKIPKGKQKKGSETDRA